MGNESERRARETMQRQHGLIHRDQAVGHGLSGGAIHRRIATGAWIRRDQAVYQHAAVTPTWESTLLGLCLATGAVASHRSAAALWGIDGYRRHGLEVTVRPGDRFDRPNATVHHLSQLDEIDCAERESIPMTEVARTVLDLAAVVSRLRLETTIDAVIRQRLLIWDDLVDVLARHSRRGRDGCGRLRAILEERVGESAIPDSAWNRRVAGLLRARGLPEAALEHSVVVNGAFLARVDLAYPELKVAIELDSVRWHLNRRSFEQDRRRQNRLVNAGWTVLSFTWADFKDDPGQLVGTVRLALDRRNREVGAR